MLLTSVSAALWKFSKTFKSDLQQVVSRCWHDRREKGMRQGGWHAAAIFAWSREGQARAFDCQQYTSCAFHTTHHAPSTLHIMHLPHNTSSHAPSTSCTFHTTHHAPSTQHIKSCIFHTDMAQSFCFSFPAAKLQDGKATAMATAACSWAGLA